MQAPAIANYGNRGNVVDLADGIVEGTDWPLVPDGFYIAVYLRHVCIELREFNNAPRVFVHLRLIDPGEHYGKVLYRAYPVRAVRRTSGKPGAPIHNGKFTLSRRSDLMKMLCRVLYQDLKTRPDRVSLRELKNHVLRIRTRTVKKDGRQRDLPPALHYSVVDDIIEKETG